MPYGIFSKKVKRFITAHLLCAVVLSFTNVVVLASFALPQLATPAEAATEINYQGKLMTSANVAVPDGIYNMEFKLYTVSSGGSAIWTETRTGSDRVQVTNGLFSVLLGSVASLAGINFDQSIYLGVNVGGTGSPSWDGEMTPRKKFASVPTAFVSDTAKALDATNATSTNLRVTNATSTNSYVANLTASSTNITGSLRISSLTGLLIGTNGSVSAISTSTLGLITTDIAEGTNLYFTNSRADARIALASTTIRNMISSTATGLTYTAGTGVLALAAGYNIPLTASTTEWASKISSQWVTSGSNIYYNTGSVGVGTASPGNKLDVVGGFINVDGSTGYKQGGAIILNASSSSASTLVGLGAGSSFNSGSYYNTAVGYYAMANTTASRNNAFGSGALRYNVTGISNVAMGNDAAGNSRGSYNIAVGDSALYYATSSSNSTAVGHSALLNSLGSGNTALGYLAGQNITSGSNNIIIGNNIYAQSATASNQLSIGNIIFGTGVDGSGTSVSSGNIGIGTTTPGYRLVVSGDFNLTGAFRTNGSAGTAGMILQTTGSGTQWVATSTLGISGGSSNYLALGNGFLATATSTDGIRAAYFVATSSTATSTFAGSVGIGTTTPASRLVVAGDAYVTGSLRVSNGSSPVVIGAVDGNSRGTNALDLQSYRTSSSQVANGLRAVALGNRNTASADDSIAIGQANTSSALFAVTLGNNNYAWGDYAIGIGMNNSVTSYSQVVGNANTSPYSFTSIFGSSNQANAPYSQIFGRSNYLQGITSSVGIGLSNLAYGGNSTIIGQENTSSDDYNVTIGYNNYAFSGTSVTIGHNNSVDNGVGGGSDVVTVGSYNTVTSTSFYSAAFGSYNTISGGTYYNGAFGYQNSVSGNSSYAIGRSNTVTGDNSYVFGNGITNSLVGSVMIGSSNANKMTLTSNGSLGIGTTTPASRLSVIGIAGGAPAFTVASSTGRAMFIVNAGGKIGVGTSTPIAGIHIDDMGGTLQQNGVQMLIDGSLANTSMLAFRIGSDAWTVGADGLNDDMFVIGKGLGYAAEGYALVIKENKNVGIGTTDPFARLQVTGTTTSAGIPLRVTDSAGASVLVARDGGAVSIGALSTGASGSQTPKTGSLNVYGTSASINIGHDSYDYGYRMVIGPRSITTTETSEDSNSTLFLNSASGGRVSIGTTTDASPYTLRVGGDINFGGDLYQDGVLFSAGGSSPWTVSGSKLYATSTAVGVGTTNPLAAFDIGTSTNGVGAMQPMLRFSYTPDVNYSSVIKTSTGGSVGQNQMGFFITRNGTELNPLLLSDSGITLTGTTTIAGILNLNNASADTSKALTLRSVSNDARDGGIKVVAQNQSQWMTLGWGGLGSTYTLDFSSGSGSDITFLSGKNTIFSTGNVGVGTTTPSARLSVVAAADTDAIVAYGGNGTGPTSVGGGFSFFGGKGGYNVSGSTQTNAGGAMTIRLGDGGDAYRFDDPVAAGSGGSFFLAAGNGGDDALSSGAFGGIGGDITLQTGLGGVLNGGGRNPNMQGVTYLNTRALTVATSSAGIKLFHVTSTTTGAMDYARVGIGTTGHWNGSDLLDQLTVSGRLYTTWRYASCDLPGISTIATVVANTAYVCGQFSFVEDADGGLEVMAAANPNYLRLRASTAGSLAVGEGASLRSWVNFVSVNENPILEVWGKAQSGLTNARYMVGFIDTATDVAADPNNGVYFRTLTSGNWIAVSRSGGTETSVNTGVAASSTAYQKLRVETGAAANYFFIDGVRVATITNNVPSANMSPIASVALITTADAVKNFDITLIRLWVDDPLGGYLTNDESDANLMRMAAGASTTLESVLDSASTTAAAKGLVTEAVTSLYDYVISGIEFTADVITRNIVALNATVKNLFASVIAIMPGGSIIVPDGENQISGSATLPAGMTTIEVLNTSVRSTSKILVTPTSLVGTPLVVTQKKEGIGFVVQTMSAPSSDVSFDWVIIQSFETGNKSKTSGASGQTFSNANVPSDSGADTQPSSETENGEALPPADIEDSTSGPADESSDPAESSGEVVAEPPANPVAPAASEPADVQSEGGSGLTEGV